MQAQNSFSEGCTDLENASQVSERAHTKRYNELYEAEALVVAALTVCQNATSTVHWCLELNVFISAVHIDI